MKETTGTSFRSAARTADGMYAARQRRRRPRAKSVFYFERLVIEWRLLSKNAPHVTA